MGKHAEFEIVELTRLKPYEHNPRKNDKAVDALAQSIRTNGFRAPILIDEDGVILAGHTRYKAAKKLGLKAAPCVIYHDMTENQKRAYRIADNKINELAKWDFDELDAELGDIDWGELETDAGEIDWGDLTDGDIEWPEGMTWDLKALGFSEHEAEGMRMDADVGAMLDTFEGTSPVRERERQRDEEAAPKPEDWEDDEPQDSGEPDAVTFIAKGNYQDFGEDFWKLAGELYARGIKTETKWGKK